LGGSRTHGPLFQVDSFHPCAELLHHPVPQQRPADEESEDGSDGGARHDEQRPQEDPEDRARGKGQDGRPREGERGLDDVDEYEDGGEQEGVRGAQIRKPLPVRPRAFQRQVLLKVEKSYAAMNVSFRYPIVYESLGVRIPYKSSFRFLWNEISSSATCCTA
jgi:hypothetical protein